MGGNINNTINTILNEHNGILDMDIKARSINYDFHNCLNYQKRSRMPGIKMFFKPKKIEVNKEDLALNQDLAIITKMNQFWSTLK